MPNFPRHVLATLLIALHASLAICGPGLHAGLGSEHARPAHSPDRPDHRQELAGLTISAAEHCPICDYFAQGQLSVTTAIPRLVQLVTPLAPIVHAVDSLRPILLSTRSRAPPSLVG